ncbi:MAG: single-stranded-DNA-specific exonuclease RecJ [Firmicutes bacterium]|nr:single-stranded-DNA-specific exonuclease RecJ [Bacillota bacterium]MBR4141891.1 single-stranded-DNA-specific exonuclease RecJ [Bacillota bacterium]MBR6969352.1 single-stranded-DNA-specific exonuclease RecJ [Bacillota bacterium]
MSTWIYQQKSNTPAWGPAGVPAAVMDILGRRGVSTPGQAEDFLAESPKCTYDPALMPDLQQAAEVLLAAAEAGKHICIYGDYDADGVTSTALLYSVLKKLTDRVSFYVPSRFTDGYGLNKDAVGRIAKAGAQLLITVDCGSTNREEVEEAKRLGMDVIVTDHHELEAGKEPDCLFVNAKRSDSQYPFSGLSGCGTAFKLAQAIQRLLASRGDDRFTRQDLTDLLDLVAISTVADVVPLLDENRSLIKYGLRVVNSRKRKGLRILLEQLKLADKQIDADDIGFILAPHINSCGRMATADAAVRLLAGIETDGSLAELAAFMIDCNKQRRSAQDETRDICLDAMQGGSCGDLFPIIEAPGAHEGVAGIVAGALKEQFNRPVCIVTPSENGLMKGTGRCIAGLDLHGMLSTCDDLFVRYGGHAGACGFSLESDRLPLLRQRMDERMREILASRPDALEEKLLIEKVLEPAEKTIEFADALKLLEPFGEANPKPLFALAGANVYNVQYMGSEGQHMRFTAVCPDGIEIPCVLFRRAADYEAILSGSSAVDVAGELGINEYNGRRKLQLTVKDIKRSGSNDQN